MYIAHYLDYKPHIFSMNCPYIIFQFICNIPIGGKQTIICSINKMVRWPFSVKKSITTDVGMPMQIRNMQFKLKLNI